MLNKFCFSLGLLTSCVVISGCSKPLTQSSALPLIQQKISEVASGPAEQGMYVDGSLSSGRFTITATTDYLDPKAYSLPDAITIRRLLQSHFLDRAETLVTYNLPHNMTESITSFITSEYHFTTEIDRTTGNIRGSGTLNRVNSILNTTENLQCATVGSIDIDGTLILGFQGCEPSEKLRLKSQWPGDQTPLQIVEFIDDPMKLNGTGGMPTLEGKASPVQITWYHYFVEQKASTFSSPSGKHILGSIKIAKVDQLVLLGSETQSRADFSWTVDKNELGRALLGDRQVSGTGDAIFSKTPDGKWIVTQLQIHG